MSMIKLNLGYDLGIGLFVGLTEDMKHILTCSAGANDGPYPSEKNQHKMAPLGKLMSVEDFKYVVSYLKALGTTLLHVLNVEWEGKEIRYWTEDKGSDSTRKVCAFLDTDGGLRFEEFTRPCISKNLTIRRLNINLPIRDDFRTTYDWTVDYKHHFIKGESYIKEHVHYVGVQNAIKQPMVEQYVLNKAYTRILELERVIEDYNIPIIPSSKDVNLTKTFN